MIDPASPVPVQSELVFYPSRTGTKLAAYIDRATEPQSGTARFIVMSPKYGETKKNNLQLAYFLAANGFTVLRFDFSCHFGESDGEMLDFTLPAAVEDTLASIDYLETQHQAKSVTLLASSLSALTAFRAVERGARIAHLVTMVGVVDLTYTLVPSDPPWWPGWRWWRDPRSAAFVDSEVFKLGFYVLRYPFGFEPAWIADQVRNDRQK